MKTNILFPAIMILLLLAASGYSQGWERLYPDLSDSRGLTAKSVVPADGGGFHVLVTDPYIAGAGGAYFVMKIDEGGILESTATLGAGGHYVAFDMIKASNSDLVIASYNTDEDNITFLRIDPAYSIVSQSDIGTAGVVGQPRGIIESPNGDFWLTGLGGVFPARSFLQKLDAQGQELGSPIYAGFDYLLATSILPDASGGVKVLGYARINNTGNYKVVLNSYAANGDFVGQSIYEAANEGLLPSDIIRTADGGMLITANSSGGEAMLIKTDNTGAEVSRTGYANSGRFKVVAEQENGSGYRILVQKQNASLVHLGLLDVDLQGNIETANEYSTHYFNNGSDLLVLPGNGSLVAGIRQRNVNTYDDWGFGGVPYIIRADESGTTLSSAIAGVVSNDDNDDCQPDGSNLSAGRFISVVQDDFLVASAQVGPTGDYLLPALPGTYQLAVNLPNYLWSSCQDTIDITIPANDTIANQDFVIAYRPEPLDSVTGYLFDDHDQDCVRDSFETLGYEGWEVSLYIYENGGTTEYVDTTDADGYYAFTNLSSHTNAASGLLFYNPPIGTGLICSYPCWQEYGIDGPFPGASFHLDNGVSCDTLPDCPVMSVAIATDEIRTCSDEQYAINYCNIGGAAATNAYLEVSIDSALTVTGSSLPWALQMGNVYTFELGDLLSNECGSINMSFTSPCNDPLGTTYCSEVYAYPDSSCVVPGPEWDESEIRIEAACDGDSIHFDIQNIGTGDMSAPLEYIVIEDNVLLYEEPQPFLLTSQEVMKVSFPANGAFYRMSSQQAEGFPGLGTPVAWVEGCGNTGDTSLGVVNQYALGDEDSWQDVFCLESVNSFDPNDKNGFPRGVSEQGFIGQGEPLEYLIRFQNIGTAEALVVEVRDTLPEEVNPYTLRPGAASHPYTWDIAGNGVIIFRFENINLPSEESDPEGSKGFVQFKVEQDRVLPIGTQINNTAAIYFDQNDPIITNQTLHTIGSDDLLTSTRAAGPHSRQEIVVFPNPTTAWLYIDVPDRAENEPLSIQFFGLLGQKVLQANFKNKTTLNNLHPLPAGLYLFSVYSDGEYIGSGKLVKE